MLVASSRQSSTVTCTLYRNSTPTTWLVQPQRVLLLLVCGMCTVPAPMTHVQTAKNSHQGTLEVAAHAQM